jgi:fructokinase
METWVAGPWLEADHARVTGARISAEEIAARAGGGDAAAQAALDRHASRLARGLAHVINTFDPDVIVLGGGLSKFAHLYEVIPDLAAPYVLAEPAQITVKPPVWGDASGTRGAAWLWGRP